MFTVDVYKKNYKKIRKIDDLISQANDYTETREKLIEKIDVVLTMAWKTVRNGFNEGSLLANKRVLMEIMPPQIEEDPIKKGIVEILRDEINNIKPEPISEGIVINKKIINPSNLKHVNLIGISIYTESIKKGCILTCSFSSGESEHFVPDSIHFDMIKEQIEKELKKLLKRMIKILKKDIKNKQKLEERLRKRLEPYIVANKI